MMLPGFMAKKKKSRIRIKFFKIPSKLKSLFFQDQGIDLVAYREGDFKQKESPIGK